MRTFVLILYLLLPAFGSQGGEPATLDPDRIDQIAAMLPTKARSVCDPISDRKRWDVLRDHPSLAWVIPQAEALLAESIPEKPESLILDYEKTGNRSNWQKVDSVWRTRLSDLFLAECLENKGRFLPALEEILTAYCDEPTWVIPAHDDNLASYHGKVEYADLKATDVGMRLGIIHHVLGEKLTPALRQRIKDEVMRRNLIPYRKQITGEGSLDWAWIDVSNNWNAVCHAGMIGAALALIDDPRERALYIAAAEAYSTDFLAGFTPDGYCSEGMAYWTYGYGHFIFLTEFIHEATGGEVDLLQLDGGRAAARFGGVLEIQNGIHPAFADCSIGSKPPPVYMYYLSRRLGFGFEEWDKIDPVGSSPNLLPILVFSFPNSADRSQPKPPDGPRLEKRTWFKDAGVLICRPGKNASTPLAVAMKGGHNNEHHNHNDVGSYFLVSRREALLVDPGGEVYTSRTFSDKRYDSDVLNSFGHAVPKVAGKLQSKGRHARGEVIHSSFTDEEDQLTIDLKSAYAVPELESLQRSFHYSRVGKGSFRVTDSVAFDSPQHFETALVTLSEWEQTDSNTVQFHGQDEGVVVAIEVTGGDFEIIPVEIKEDVRTSRNPIRIGIRMKKPVKEATITLTIFPDVATEFPDAR